MRRALLLAVLVSLLGASAAEAQYRWPGETVPYFNAAKRYKAQVADAVRAWNGSGVDLRWVKASRATATARGVVIGVSDRTVGRHGGPSALGVAEVRVLGRRATARIHLVSNLLRLRVAGPRVQATQVIAHEMGHVVGLGHDDRGCATMNTAVNAGCAMPPEAWQYHCRILRPVDVRRAIKLHGGSLRMRTGPVFCARPRPPRIAGLSVAMGPDGRTPILSWRNPKGDVAEIEIARGDVGGACPGRDEIGFLGDAPRGASQTLEDETFLGDVGRYCYSAVTLDSFGRRSLPVTSTFDFRGSAPDADFDWEADLDPLTIAFDDISFDPDGDIATWSWSFGDGSPPSADEDPVHAFAAVGTYQVTLTVADSVGNTASVTLPVTVE